jgi:hypothetical protein
MQFIASLTRLPTNKTRAASGKTLFITIFIGIGVKAQLTACRRELTKKGSFVYV